MEPEASQQTHSLTLGQIEEKRKEEEAGLDNKWAWLTPHDVLLKQAPLLLFSTSVRSSYEVGKKEANKIRANQTANCRVSVIYLTNEYVCVSLNQKQMLVYTV